MTDGSDHPHVHEDDHEHGRRGWRRALGRLLGHSHSGAEHAHRIAHDAHHRLLHELPRAATVIIHTSPADSEGTDYHAQLAHHADGRPHHHR